MSIAEVFAYTLNVTTCNLSYATTGDTIGIGFCQGGTYCTPTDEVMVTPNDGLGVAGLTIGVPVSVGYEPTTLVVSNPSTNSWCLGDISWEGGDNLLGDSGAVWFDSEIGGDNGCKEGLPNPGSAHTCQGSWRFFNVNGVDDYTYDVTVTACEGTKSATINASFCSTTWCSDDSGEVAPIILTMNDIDGGHTIYEVALPFNPLAMKLLEIDSDWCADAMTYNGFTLLDGSTAVGDFDNTDENGTRTMIVTSLQYIGEGFAYTLNVTTCNLSYATTGDTIGIGFCQGGTYCTPTDEVMVTPNDGLGVAGFTIGVPVSVGYEPTTLVVSNPSTNAWCLGDISWDGGENLLGDSGAVWFDSEIGGDNGCNEGLSNPGSAHTCQGSWRFFNVNGVDDYTYDVKVTACEGTKSATVNASFCSTTWCSDDSGEVAPIILTMNDIDGGHTTYQVALPFNPLAMKLLEIDSDWCADAMTYNGFTLLDGSTSVADFDNTDEDGTRTMIVTSLQYIGLDLTPSPTPSPTPALTSSRTTPPLATLTSSPTPASSLSSTPRSSQLSVIGGWVVGFVLLAVQVLTCVFLKKRLAAQDRRILPTLQALCATGSFWSAMVVLTGLFVTLNIFNFGSMWGIVSVCAAFVLWWLVVAWFIAFRTGTLPTN